MKIQILKIFSVALATLLSSNVYSLDFFGQNLENSSKEQLEKLITDNAGILKHKTVFSTTYLHKVNDDKNKIYARWSKIFFNTHGEFVGLQIGVHDNNDRVQQTIIRQSLVDKYGQPPNAASKTFHTASFHGNAAWDFENDMRISYSNDVFRTLARQNTLEEGSSTVISYFHKIRRDILVQDIKHYLYKNEEKKVKKVF